MKGGIYMADFEFDIVEELGVLSESRSGWTKELNFISWNGADLKYDIRDWSPDHERMSKGITLSVDEFNALKKIISTME